MKRLLTLAVLLPALAAPAVLLAETDFAATAGAGSTTPGPQHKYLKAFPKPEPGQKRYVLILPEQDDESRYRVELIVGKTVTTDAVNQYFFGGRIEAVNVEGWGFTRYAVDKLGPMAGTLMAPDPAAAQVERFVTLGGEPYLVRYNSKLPLVVSVPDDAQVRYRIWQAPAESAAMDEG